MIAEYIKILTINVCQNYVFEIVLLQKIFPYQHTNEIIPDHQFVKVIKITS